MNISELMAQVKKQLPFEGRVEIRPTGSRVFGDYTGFSDWDFVIWVPELDLESLASEGLTGYKLSGGSDYPVCDGHCMFRSTEKEPNINLIFVESFELLDRWNRCTQVAQELKLTKAQRGTLFSTIID